MTPTTSVQPILEARALRRTFGAFVAVKDVSFEVQEGEIFGYLGANGAGKSTTIRMLTGLMAPSGGSARVAGHDIATASRQVKGAIGYMSQRFSLYLDLSAQDNLEFFAGIYGLGGKARRAAIDHTVARTGLGDVRGTLTGAMPGGVRQRLALACSLLHRPKLLFLDEPTAGVDPASRRDFWRLIRELAASGTTIFVTTHYMDEAEYCGRVGMMVDGALVALDTPAGLKAAWVPGRSFAIEGEGLRGAYAAVRALPMVLAAEPFGARMHVRVAADQRDARAITAAIEAAGARVLRVEPVEASLEDVFLAVVGGSTHASKPAEAA